MSSHPSPSTAFAPTVYLRDLSARPRWLAAWEKHRHTHLHWLVELFAEACGVFFYVYAGVGATAAFITSSTLGEAGFGSLFTIGLGYAFGIILALVICASTSGGHFNPCVSICLVLYRGFPPLKALRYIAAQIFGGYIACLLVYVQYKDFIVAANAALEAKGPGILEATQFTPLGTAGIFALYVTEGSNLARVLLNEFVSDVFIGMTIWAILDHSNFMAPPAAGPFLVAFAYAAVIWGFSPVGLAANTARDLGGRLAAMSIWGMKASGGKYAAIAALTNIPAQLFGATLYEVFLADSSRVLPSPHIDYIRGHMQHMRQRGQPINPVKPNLPMFADICEDQDNDGKSGSEEERYERSNKV